MTPQDFPRFDPEKPVAIIGAGVMGTKVAWACARAGISTRLYDVEPGKAASSIRLAQLWSAGAEADRVRQLLAAAPSLKEAQADTQLCFENVPERLELKRSVLADMGAVAPADAYLGSNASSLLCTPLAEASGRPERFFNLNFTDPRYGRLVELMISPTAAPQTIAFAKAWARAVGMVPIRTRKEQHGYVFNRLWRAIKKEVLRQISEGYATPQDIDRAWMLAFGTDIGPCGWMDDIGLHSILAVERVYFELSGQESDRPPKFLVDMVERGELGAISGRGFYQHPGAAYHQPGFLEAEDQA
ncbi:MAG TPA: 3-hydroxyacyl-CoA dehydrogenase family protein [Caulobacteraceae bacterium]|nr:3-hydroxyacyl-CoA dehydrogenase family protein [Caulobacteraceae bacterium]